MHIVIIRIRHETKYPGFRLQDAEMIQQAAVDSCQILEIPK